MKKKKRRLKKSAKIFFTIIILIILAFLLKGIYNFSLKPVNKSEKIITVEIKSGMRVTEIANVLKKNKLVKSKLSFKIYYKFNKKDNLKAGVYKFKQNMGTKKIISYLEEGSDYNPDLLTLTFKEGINMRKIVSIIAEKTNNSEEDIYNLLKDQSYLDELINKYWFLTDSIKNEEIYYPLEGYLFPDTYQFDNKDVSVKEIIEKMLDNMEKKLESYKNVKSNYSIHELLTMASIVELEATNSDDRKGVAGVFYNRLNNGWALGSDVTTYYSIKVDMSERDLYQSELDSYNAYNTRSSKMAGKLPVGPVCIPSIESIEAAFNPTKHNYYYFVADKNKKTYFSKTANEHNKIVKKLKEDGLWYEY